MAKLIDFLKSQINEGHSRSVAAKKNIVASFFIRGVSIAISLALVPLTISYINPSGYGIWLTLSSIVAWFSFFDIGLTQGLRNKFAEARALNDDNRARIYVSTTYAILCITFTAVLVLFFFVNRFLDWPSILNVQKDLGPEISALALIVFAYFCIQFVLRIIVTILTADQKPAKASLLDLFGQLLSLIIVFILVKTTEGSLINLGIALCVSPLVVLLAANILVFRGEYKAFRPSFSSINFSYAKGLLNLGIIFFIIQVAGIIQYQTANIIIARNFSTADVTSYNIVFKYFGVLNMVFTIFLTPFWSASTEAYLKNDIQWIKNGIRKYNILNVLLFAGGVVMLVFSDLVYRLWLGEGKVAISFALSFWGFLYFNATMFGAKYVNFLNGINALKIQFWASVISPFLYIATANLFIRSFNMGVYSLFIASIISNFNGILFAPYQYRQIIIRNRKGIWIK